MYDLVIKNGHLITPSASFPADLAIDGEQIAALGMHLNGDAVLDASGCYVLSGGVDCHVHLQLQLPVVHGQLSMTSKPPNPAAVPDPSSASPPVLTSTDSFTTGTMAAACGGTTTVIDFTDPQPGQGLLASLQARQEEARDQVAVDYGLHMTIPTWHGCRAESLGEIPATVAAGCATFKLYQAYNRMQLDDVALLRVMRAVSAAGGGVVLHSETGPLLDLLRADAVASGAIAPIWHERTRPARLEATAVQRAAEIAALAACPLHLFHLGSAASLAEVIAARKRGVDISAETCPHYLLLTADEHLAGADGHLFICAPPLRSSADQAALWLALADGSLEIISTDHCPWTRQEKMQPVFVHVPGGVPSIEARLALVHQFGVNEQELALTDWVRTCCMAPARRMGLQWKGALLPGYDADIVIFDPQREKTVSTKTLHEAADWTPYEGMQLRGWPRTVLLRGEVIVRDEEYVGRPGQGRFIRRSLPPGTSREVPRNTKLGV